MELQKFKYHSYSFKTASIKQSENECEVCKQQKGYVSTSPIYAVENVDNICS
ncbi:hypothetical protein CPU12_02560 [Malaciobacter molluscorum LMG 25693]|uniref:Uncharacterized protein n=1 Tax=Malaciobacter molluscorum LMG 25693 TaxID=870501 RepID=A0A2G1DL70_9BACT|nr:hypothetical protein AMOL_1765 [Malaciobacter molluscorum LMG 25693]PHO19144.1 hypothetical protein CPU12_02560 [Malaciobacter molluscorum LMG 25693]